MPQISSKSSRSVSLLGVFISLLHVIVSVFHCFYLFVYFSFSGSIFTHVRTGFYEFAGVFRSLFPFMLPCLCIGHAWTGAEQEEEGEEIKVHCEEEPWCTGRGTTSCRPSGEGARCV